MSAYYSHISRIRASHGKPYLAPTDTFNDATLEALRDLASDAGLTPTQAMAARPTDLLRIYTCAASANAQQTPSVARRMGEMIDKRGGTPASPNHPDAPLPIPTAPIAPALDLGPVMAQIAALQAELDALKASRPMTVEVVHAPPSDLASVTIDNAHPIFPMVLKFIAAREHVFIHGPRGSGKTTLAGQVAKALGLKLYATGAIKDTARLIGFISPLSGQYHRTAFREAFEHGGLFLFDEVTASDENAILDLNMALANGYYAFDDGLVMAHPDFVMIAGDNTDGTGATEEYNGRNKMDGSFLDRFAMLEMDYDEVMERAITDNAAWAAHVQRFRAFARREDCRLPSPRATVKGAKMLAAGISWEEVENAYLYREMEETQINRMRSLMN